MTTDRSETAAVLRSSPADRVTADERGATLLEYVLVLACLAIILMTGVPGLEDKVEGRIDDGAQLWAEYNIDDI